MKNKEKYRAEIKEELRKSCGATGLRDKALKTNGKTCHGTQCADCDVIFANWLDQDAEEPPARDDEIIEVKKIIDRMIAICKSATDCNDCIIGTSLCDYLFGKANVPSTWNEKVIQQHTTKEEPPARDGVGTVKG